MRFFTLLYTLTYVSLVPVFSIEKTVEQAMETTKNSNFDNNSSANRSSKEFELLANIGLDYSMPGAGVTLGYHIDPNSIIELNYFSGSDKAESSNSREDKGEIKGISASYKLFTGNSFYLAPGAFFVNYKYNYIADSNLLSYRNRNFKRSDTGISFRIGNQWQWKNFTLGCDWFGIQYGLINNNRSGEINSFIPTTAERTKWISATLLRLSVGATF